MGPYIIAYTYDADVHCTFCATSRFGTEAIEARVAGLPGYNNDDGFDTYGIAYDQQDSEGNEVHPVFSTDEMSEFGEWCGDCGAVITEPWED